MTGRNTLILIYNRYTYLKEKTQARSSFWHCRQSQALHCKARITLDNQNNKFKTNGVEHNHDVIEGLYFLQLPIRSSNNMPSYRTPQDRRIAKRTPATWIGTKQH